MNEPEINIIVVVMPERKDERSRAYDGWSTKTWIAVIFTAAFIFVMPFVTVVLLAEGK